MQLGINFLSGQPEFFEYDPFLSVASQNFGLRVTKMFSDPNSEAVRFFDKLTLGSFFSESISEIFDEKEAIKEFGLEELEYLPRDEAVKAAQFMLTYDQYVKLADTLWVAELSNFSLEKDINTLGFVALSYGIVMKSSLGRISKRDLVKLDRVLSNLGTDNICAQEIFEHNPNCIIEEQKILLAQLRRHCSYISDINSIDFMRSLLEE